MEQVKTQQVVRTTSTARAPKAYETKKAIFRTYQVIWYILGVVETTLGLRILLKALGANPLSGFTSFIYGFTDPFALPFRGIFRTAVAGGAVFEWSTLFAAVVYAIIAYGLVYLLQLVKPVDPIEVEETVDNA